MVPEKLRGKVDSLYQEVWGLARDIVQARAQIAELRPGALKRDNLPRAIEEMHEIVKTTEVASNAIMESAEAITDAMPEQIDEEFREIVQKSCQRIFESCAFQDLTGQRISKVMLTLRLIEEHLETLQGLLGAEFDDPEANATPEGDADLLAGPALEGEGISQDDVDKMFDSM
ncbi:MAG: chemotaxis protein CheZ [Proteobacteria bacterium]|nr:chemotaxis protein CheZ [Pseudomonadota bacterium]MDA1357296.1 chemotaxis protein CheZ [Pseudomonadota bacterium]